MSVPSSLVVGSCLSCVLLNDIWIGLWVECCVGGFGLVWYEIVFVEVGDKLCEVLLCMFL